MQLGGNPANRGAGHVRPFLKMMPASDNNQEGQRIKALFDDSDCAKPGEVAMVHGDLFLVLPLSGDTAPPKTFHHCPPQ